MITFFDFLPNLNYSFPRSLAVSRRSRRGNMAKSTGDILPIVRNDAKLYEGDLIYYFQIVFKKATNVHNGYHNARHMLHVFWLCYQACKYYHDQLSRYEMRILLIAALFHDFDHRGVMGDDALNLMLAKHAFKKYMLDMDRPNLPLIEEVMDGTEFPYKTRNEQLGILAQILRDADGSQALDPVWLQQVVYGFAREWDISPLEALKRQEPFLINLKFATAWARLRFPQDEIDAKIREARGYIELLEMQLVPA